MKKKITLEQWEKAIREAREFYNKLDQHRFRVAEICLGVCDVVHGGRVDHRFTITAFARAIGIHHKTLTEWCRIKRLVVDKLPASILKKESRYETYRMTVGSVTSDSTTQEVLTAFKSFSSIDPRLDSWNKYEKVVNTIIYNASKPINLMNIPHENIMSMQNKLNLANNLLIRELEFRKTNDSGAKALMLKKVNKFKRSIDMIKEI